MVTLCAEEVCPAYLGQAKRVHWPFEDPAAREGSEEEVLESFRRARDAIGIKVRELFRS